MPGYMLKFIPQFVSVRSKKCCQTVAVPTTGLLRYILEHWPKLPLTPCKKKTGRWQPVSPSHGHLCQRQSLVDLLDHLLTKRSAKISPDNDVSASGPIFRVFSVKNMKHAKIHGGQELYCQTRQRHSSVDFVGAPSKRRTSTKSPDHDVIDLRVRSSSVSDSPSPGSKLENREKTENFPSWNRPTCNAGLT